MAHPHPVDAPRLPHAWLVRLGKAKSVTLITLASIALSWLFTGIAMLIEAHEGLSAPGDPGVSLAVATVVPLVVAPIVSSWCMDLLLRLESALELASRLARTDALTGLGNRRHFLEAAGRVLEECRSRATAAALMLVDIDDFKHINDSCGHAVGDEVIGAVGRACATVAPSTATAARIGGEEFAVLLDGEHAEQAAAIAEALRARVAGLACAGGRVRVTACIGVAVDAPARESLATLMQSADQQLYAAKAAGKNRVRVAATAFPPAPSGIAGIDASAV
ncbi:MAG: GGDEF domain-containing protein [Xanthomonadales bacterium]|nr:GGDEF domain-containing protein [Xanthomonadales bacterium]